MDDIEGIRQRKMMELQAQLQAKDENEQAEVAMRSQLNAILNAVLSPEARARLKNVELANPALAANVVKLIIYLYQAGQVSHISDDQLKALLLKISSRRKDTSITIKRK